MCNAQPRVPRTNPLMQLDHASTATNQGPSKLSKTATRSREDAQRSFSLRARTRKTNAGSTTRDRVTNDSRHTASTFPRRALRRSFWSFLRSPKPQSASLWNPVNSSAFTHPPATNLPTDACQAFSLSNYAHQLTDNHELSLPKPGYAQRNRLQSRSSLHSGRGLPTQQYSFAPEEIIQTLPTFSSACSKRTRFDRPLPTSHHVPPLFFSLRYPIQTSPYTCQRSREWLSDSITTAIAVSYSVPSQPTFFYKVRSPLEPHAPVLPPPKPPHTPCFTTTQHNAYYPYPEGLDDSWRLGTNIQQHISRNIRALGQRSRFSHPHQRHQ